MGFGPSILTKLIMGKRFRYLLGRSWLAGMFTWFPAGLLGSIIGIFLFVHAQSNLTPYSVGVRGYYRSNGTYVSSYTRRPPGSVKHDDPYEGLRLFAGFIVIAGTAASGISLYRIVKVPDIDLLPRIDYKSHLPEKPCDILIPHKLAKARSTWLCMRCCESINPGDIYFYYGDSWRTRFCPNCRLRLMDEKRSQEMKMLAYMEAVKKEETERQALRTAQYRHFYGSEASISLN